MIYYFGKTFSDSVTLQRLEDVTCEKCGTSYAYVLTRHGEGSGTAPYLIGQTSAANRAAKAAEAEALKRLDGEAELVPCPDCGWVNEELVRRFRRGRFRRAWWIILIVIFLGVVGYTATRSTIEDMFGFNSEMPRRIAIGLLALAAVTPLVVLAIRGLLRRRINPNRDHPQPPRLPKLTPPALVAGDVDEDGEATLEAVSREEEEWDDGWVYFRLGAVALPERCAACGEPTSVCFELPVKLGADGGLPVGLCLDCGPTYRRRWWLVFLLTTSCTLLLSWLIGVLFDFDQFGRMSLIFTFGVIGGLLLGIITAGLTVKPYRFRTFDLNRGIYKLRARSEDYENALDEAARAADGW